MTDRQISDAGIGLIRSFEGCSLKAYPDPATGGEPITIGYGHTGGVKITDAFTQLQAEELLRSDLEKFELGVNRLVHADINQNQFDALVSFAFNCGLQNLATSTLLRMINQGSANGAGSQFLRWNKASGRVMPGLTRRRTAEKQLYESRVGL